MLSHPGPSLASRKKLHASWNTKYSNYDEKRGRWMNGFLGTSASVWSDLALVLSLALVAVAVLGAVRARRQRFPAHCRLMAPAAFLNWIPVLLVMLPAWFRAAGGDPQITGPLGLAPVFHGVLGGLTQLLMTYTVVRMSWAENLPPGEPLWLMRATAILWLLAMIGGSAVYVVTYVV